MKSELAKQLNVNPEWISNIQVDEINHSVVFKCGNSDYSAKLSKNNKTVKKNSVRLF